MQYFDFQSFLGAPSTVLLQLQRCRHSIGRYQKAAAYPFISTTLGIARTFGVSLAIFGFSFSASAQLLDKGIQADILSQKIVSLIKSERIAESVPLFEELEALGMPLTESVRYFYVEALDKAGRSKPALARATDYLGIYGKAAKHYDKAIEIVGRLTDVVKKEAAIEANALKAKQDSPAFEEMRERLKEEKYRVALKKYDQDVVEYKKEVDISKKNIAECLPRIRAELAACEAVGQKRYGGFFSDRAALESQSASCWDRYNPDHCERTRGIKAKFPEKPKP